MPTFKPPCIMEENPKIKDICECQTNCLLLPLIIKLSYFLAHKTNSCVLLYNIYIHTCAHKFTHARGIEIYLSLPSLSILFEVFFFLDRTVPLNCLRGQTSSYILFPLGINSNVLQYTQRYRWIITSIYLLDL